MASREYRDKLRSEGRCTECAKTSPGKRVCRDCQEKNRKMVAAFTAARKSGKCSHCGGTVLEGLSLCLSCKDAIKFDSVRASVKAKTRRKNDRDERTAKGLCLYCDTPKSRDRPCCEEHTLYFEQRRRSRYEAGLCDWCDSPRTVDTQLCEAHLAKSREYRLTRGRFFNARSKAKGRGLSFGITRESYEAKVKLPCDYCGFPIPPSGTGLDRMDNSRGYEDDNTVPCCEECNAAKSDFFTYEETKQRIVSAIRDVKLARLGLLPTEAELHDLYAFDAAPV
jgi:hypothetical protein